MARKKGSVRVNWKNFERNIAKMIGRWWLSNPQSFKRLACSGAFPRKKADGDIVPVTEEAATFPFAVECKRRPSEFTAQDLWTMLSAEKSAIFKWFSAMNNLESVCLKKKMRWLIIFERSGNHLLIFGAREKSWLEERLKKIDINMFRLTLRDKLAQSICESPLYICLFKDFLNYCSNPSLLGSPFVANSTTREVKNTR